MHICIKGSLLLWAFFSFQSLNAQSSEAILTFARNEIDTLCSASLAGRGYIQDGHKKAALYLAQRFQDMGLTSMREMAAMGVDRYFQSFPLRINRIRNASLILNGEEIIAGQAFIVNRFSGSGEVSGKVLDCKYGLKPNTKVFGNIALIRAGFPPKIANDSEKRKQYKDLAQVSQRVAVLEALGATAVIVIQPKLTAGFAREVMKLPVVEVQEDQISGKIKRAEIKVESALEDLFSQNVIGWLQGQKYPDSLIIISAHYDHLGMLGPAVFTGANDNASGTSMLLSMAEYFVDNPLDYSLMFIAFGGEETGLIGSNYYVHQNPAHPLDQTKFILNLDLMGNGIEGITAVGGKDYPQHFERLVSLNDSLQSVPKVRSRKNAPNSDHYFFLEAGVPGFFIYTLGGPKHYHDVHDNPGTIVLSKYVEVRELLIRFLEEI